jgi:hypothetical protein
MANLSPVQQHFINKALESNFALWNALLTVNGIMLTAFSILPMVSPAANKLLSLLLVACCSISLLLLVWNFLVTKQHYLEIGQMISRLEADLSAGQKRENIRAEKRQHRNVQLREKAALLLLVGESILISVLLFLAGP